VGYQEDASDVSETTHPEHLQGPEKATGSGKGNVSSRKGIEDVPFIADPGGRAGRSALAVL